jgi:hypothetical protein
MLKPANTHFWLLEAFPLLSLPTCVLSSLFTTFLEAILHFSSEVKKKLLVPDSFMRQCYHQVFVSSMLQELLFCETCDTVFCTVCTGGSHSTSGPSCEHTIIPFSIAIKRMSEILLYKANECISKVSLSSKRRSFHGCARM